MEVAVGKGADVIMERVIIVSMVAGSEAGVAEVSAVVEADGEGSVTGAEGVTESGTELPDAAEVDDLPGDG